jgi:hypothetical protein
MSGFKTMNMCVPEASLLRHVGGKKIREVEGEMVSLKGSRRHAGICVAVIIEKAMVVANVMIVASDEMVTEDVD